MLIGVVLPYHVDMLCSYVFPDSLQAGSVSSPIGDIQKACRSCVHVKESLVAGWAIQAKLIDLYQKYNDSGFMRSIYQSYMQSGALLKIVIL